MTHIQCPRCSSKNIIVNYSNGYYDNTTAVCDACGYCGGILEFPDVEE